MGTVDGLLTVGEAADYLKISPWTLRHWVSSRKIQHVKMGNLVRLRQSDLDRFVAKNVVKVSNGNGRETNET